jgi:hypothetical protein
MPVWRQLKISPNYLFHFHLKLNFDVVDLHITLLSKLSIVKIG